MGNRKRLRNIQGNGTTSSKEQNQSGETVKFRVKRHELGRQRTIWFTRATRRELVLQQQWLKRKELKVSEVKF